MDDLDVAISELRSRLLRYPEDRYPVQHATAQFHLAVALLNSNSRAEQAEVALRTACRLFDPERLPVEHAKATNMLGAALRLNGRLAEAVEAFARAAGVFAEAQHPLERAAALYNLGLVHRECDDPDAAAECFERSWQLFDESKAPAQASAAARELGGVLLAQGSADAATGALERAVQLAERAGEASGLGAATNLLGLAHLAAGRGEQAIDAFRRAAAAHPRSVRPQDFAMAKANLALAYEQSGDHPRARLAAGQALGAPEPPEQVDAQAREVLARLGSDRDDLFAVLDTEPLERWPAIVREEVTRAVDADEAERRALAETWIDGQLARPGSAAELAETWLGALLEQPPDAMTAVIRSVLAAHDERPVEERDRFRAQAARGMIAYPPPQWLRLKDTFNALAVELGGEPAWG